MCGTEYENLPAAFPSLDLESRLYELLIAREKALNSGSGNQKREACNFTNSPIGSLVSAGVEERVVGCLLLGVAVQWAIVRSSGGGRPSVGGASDCPPSGAPQLLRARSYKLDLIWTAARAGLGTMPRPSQHNAARPPPICWRWISADIHSRNRWNFCGAFCHAFRSFGPNT